MFVEKSVEFGQTLEWPILEKRSSNHTKLSFNGISIANIKFGGQGKGM